MKLTRIPKVYRFRGVKVLNRMFLTDARQLSAYYLLNAGKVPNSYRRKQKREYLATMKRLEAEWAVNKKPVRQTISLKRSEEVKKYLDAKLRIQAFAAHRKNMANDRRKKDKSMLIFEKYLAELKFFPSESALTLPTVYNQLYLIYHLTEMKMKRDRLIQAAVIQSKLLKFKLTEKRRYLVDIQPPRNSLYCELKKNNNIENHSFMKTKMSSSTETTELRLTLEKMLAEIQINHMKLKDTFDELSAYTYLRDVFTSQITLAINQLNYAKDIVLKLVDKSHEKLIKIFRNYEVFSLIARVRETPLKALKKRSLIAADHCIKLRMRLDFQLKKYAIFKRPLKPSIIGEPRENYCLGEDDVKIFSIATYILQYQIKSKTLFIRITKEEEYNYFQLEQIYLLTFRIRITMVNNKFIETIFQYRYIRNKKRIVKVSLNDHIRRLEARQQHIYKYYKVIQIVYNNSDTITHYHNDNDNNILEFFLVKDSNKQEFFEKEFNYIRILLAERNNMIPEEDKILSIVKRRKQEALKKQLRCKKYIKALLVNPELVDEVVDDELLPDPLCPLCLYNALKKSLKFRRELIGDIMDNIKDLETEAQSYFFIPKNPMLYHDIAYCDLDNLNL